MPAESAGFFDVDETLIVVQSMFSFLRHYLDTARGPRSYPEVARRLRVLAADGASRAEVLRAYYRCYAGTNVAEIAAQGEVWFDRERRARELFLPRSLEAFLGHRGNGDLTVLLSGSFGACLNPIARWLGADLVCGTCLETADGVYTGEVRTMMLGSQKARMAETVMASHGLRPTACHAYGDDSSDLPLLLAVGHPVVVGNDPVLTEHAIASNWPRLPGTGTRPAVAVSPKSQGS
jgi:HAD superfamily hydrolase (TIGR01490 family)